MPASAHTLLIGATGMLADAALELAGQARAATIIARSHLRLNALVRRAPGGNLHPLAADWHDNQAFALALRTAIAAHGPVDLAVCWVHADAAGALRQSIATIASTRNPPRVFHIMGSSSENPAAAVASEVAGVVGIRCRRIVLGSIIEPGGSRRLTHAEISRGVVDAVFADRADTIVGVVRPWAASP